MTETFPPTICVDGTAARRIREEKQLTQLYVSKVVGVTTDTISRWENNRYPSIKRENALRLAEALEVPIEAIVRADECASAGAGEAGDEAQGAAQIKIPWRLVFVLLALVIASAAYYYYFQNRSLPVFHLSAQRQLPAFAAPGSVIPVRVQFEADLDLKGIIVREHFPAGWKLIEANPPPSSLDNERGTARWIIKQGDKRRMIAYLVKVASDAGAASEASDARFALLSGEIVVDRRNPLTIGGLDTITIAPYHWADRNGDSVVDDSEMLLASDTFDDMKGVHLNWPMLEALWDSGRYRWDAKKNDFVPVKPAPVRPKP